MLHLHSLTALQLVISRTVFTAKSLYSKMLGEYKQKITTSTE